MKKYKVYVIAEAGVNHDGSVVIAKKLVDVACDAGADAVKFQTFRADGVVTKSAPMAEYQKQSTGKAESQWNMIKKLELDKKAHQKIYDYCSVKGIEFLSTPFDEKSVILLGELGLDKIKISSGDLTNAPLLLQIARLKKDIVLSTGMATLSEIKEALSVLSFGLINSNIHKPTRHDFKRAYQSRSGQKALKKTVSLLHCTSDYPARLQDVNLLALSVLQERFGLPVGYSDHTLGHVAALGAVARGAVIIEKHITLDKNRKGPDHPMSMEPQAFKQLIKDVRDMESALGVAQKELMPSEKKNKIISRKSVVAAGLIKVGDLFSTKNLTIKRPETGISPIHYWRLLGKRAKRSFKKDEVIVEARPK